MNTPFATRFAAACASLGTTFVLLWAVASLAGSSADQPIPVAQPAAPAAVTVASADR